MSHVIRGTEVAVKVSEALGLDPGKVRRIVLDIRLDDAITAYVEMYGDARLLDLRWELEGVKIEYPDGLSGEAKIK